MFRKSNVPTFALISAFLLSLISCSDDDTAVPFSGNYETGVFITNEGPFQSGSGTVSYYNSEADTLENEVFQKVNAGQELGNILQSMTIDGDQGFLHVNNANTVHVVNANDMASIGSFEAELPRYMVTDGNNGYLSQWAGSSGGSVSIVDLTNSSITATISTRGAGAEKLVVNGNRLYVANSGGFGTDSTVAVIDLDSREVIKTLAVGTNPTSMVKDKDNNIWVFGKGFSDWYDPSLNTEGLLVKITNDEVALSLPVENNYQNNMAISPEGDLLYLATQTAVYTHDVASTTFDDTPFINKGFYGLGVHPVTGNIYGADAGDFQSRGEVTIYSPAGEELRSIEVGIIPNGFVFK